MPTKSSLMKKLLLICLAFAALGIMSMSYNDSTNSPKTVNAEYVYIKLKNDCDHAVKYEYKDSGSGTSGTLSANYTRQITLKTGAKLYIDGQFLKEITISDNTQVIIACE